MPRFYLMLALCYRFASSIVALVTMGDYPPLGETLDPGDEICFRVFLVLVYG